MRSVGLDLLSENLNKIIEELAVKVAGSIASSARKTLLVDLCAVASEADNCVVLFNGFFGLFWSQNLTVNFLFHGFNFELATFAFGLD